jgi:hemerythrin-like domain-containing protein
MSIAAASGVLWIQNRQKSLNKEPEVTATEDLMREHGVLRRALIVYSETAPKIRTISTSVPAKALADTAYLFRSFGENYHEKQLEEAYIFPVVRKVKGQAGRYPDILQMQHERGREITEYILQSTRGGSIPANRAVSLADALAAFVRMYRAHAAIEDTVVFPTWKEELPEKQLQEMSDKFEDIEHAEFGADGFEDAVKRISAIEMELGLADLNTFTAPAVR